MTGKAKPKPKPRPKWKRIHAQRGMELMNIGQQLTELKDRYRRDLKQYLDMVKQSETLDDHDSVLAFMDGHADFGKRQFAVMSDEAATILEALGGPIDEE